MRLPPIKFRIRALLALFFLGLTGAVLWVVEQTHTVIRMAGEVGDSAAAAEIVRMEQGFSDLALSFGLVVGVLGLVAAVYFDREVFSVMNRLSQHMKALAARDYSRAAEGAQRSDEIGDMARAIDVLRANGLELLRLEGETARRAEVIASERRDALQAMGAQLEAQMASLLEGLTRSSQAMIFYL